MAVTPAISVIIPALNEAAALPALLKTLAGEDSIEVLVVDGGSTDRTAEVARPYASVLLSPPWRSRQMNTGAAQARGEILLFLHADVELRRGAVSPLKEALLDPKICGGNFEIRYQGNDLAAQVFNRITKVRNRFGVFYGDSGIFVRRDVFIEIGGYPEWPILEDYWFARQIWKRGKVVFLNEPIFVSDRRWRRGGLLRTLLSWLLIQSLYLAGVSPHRLARLYNNIR